MGEIQVEKQLQVEDPRLSEGTWYIPETTSSQLLQDKILFLYHILFTISFNVQNS